MPSAIGYPRDKKLGTAKMRRLTTRAKELLAQAREERQPREAKWRAAEKMYVGKHYDGVDAGSNDLVVVNYAGSTINTIIPFVAANPPQFRVDPYGGEATVSRARQQTAFLNRWWRSNDIDGNAVLQDILFDYLVYGDGNGMPIWSLTERADPENQFEDLVYADIDVERISPWDIWRDVHERWVIRRVRVSVEELKQDPKYHNTKNLKASDAARDDREERDVNTVTAKATNHERDQLVDVYELYDLVTDDLLVFTEDSDVPLRYVADIKFPIVNMGNYNIPGSPYHMGELEQIGTLQEELNKARSQMVTHRRRNVQKFAVRSGALGADGKAALKSEIVNDVVEIEDRGQDLDDLIVPLDVPLLSPDAYNSAEISKQDIFDITGVSEYLRGSVPSGRRTATEASIIEGSNNVKTSHKLKAVEEALEKIGQLIIEIAREIFPLTDVDEASMIITGRDAQAVAAAGGVEGVAPEEASTVPGIRIDPAENEGEMWKGVYQVFVEAASTELRDPFVREQKYRQLFQDIMVQLPALQAQGINVDVRKLLELWLESAGVEDFESIFGTAPPPQRTPEELSGIQQGGNGLGQLEGLPATGNAGPPADVVDPTNSGLLG
jgi:hypothetical protein